jgi:DNA-binding Xre family transcriptional regulator
MFDVIKIQLAELLKKRNKSMYALAKETKISYTTIHKLCKKPVGSIDLDILEKLCRNLKCRPNDLLGLEI